MNFINGLQRVSQPFRVVFCSANSAGLKLLTGLFVFSCPQFYLQGQTIEQLEAAEAQSEFMGLIEFLGEFETDTGEFIDPAEMEQEVFADLPAPASNVQEPVDDDE